MATSLEPIVTAAFAAFLLVRLATRHGSLRRWGRGWSSAVDEQLGALGSALTHPVHDSIDRVAAFEETAARVVDREGALREEAMVIARAHSVDLLRRPLDATDVEAFWRVVRAEIGMVIDLR